MLLEPVGCKVSLVDGVLEGGTGRYEKRLGEMAGLYGDKAAFEALLSAGDRSVYAVAEFRASTRASDMIFGVTKMEAGRIGREFFFTRGHIHARADRPEIYYGQSGRGLMHLETPAGETRVVEIDPQTICYVPPYWIHRSVNAGDEPLVMMFAYPANSGQDYAIIERAGGMRHRILSDGRGGWELAENSSYRPRSLETAAAITAA